MTTFERELRKMFDKNTVMSDTKFIGRTCYGKVNDNLNARIEFVTCGTHGKYEALKATLINKKEGVIDQSLIKLNDFIGPNRGSNEAFKAGTPYLWTYNGETEWYGYNPTKKDYNQIIGMVRDYLDMFREPEMEQSAEQGMILQ